MVFLSLARDLYRTNRPKEGRAALIAGASATTDHGRKAYRTELAWVATAEELIQWDSLPTRDRPAWLAGFWSGRDVVEGRLDGERLIEHYRRVEYAMAHFRIGEPDTDRERTLRFLRSDEYVPEQQSLSFAARNANLCPQAARFATDARLYGADAPTRYFQPSQDVLDDRGAVWIRHGPPTKSRQSNGIEGVEIWRYERPEGSLVLQFRKAAFRGTSGVSVLVPSLMTISPGLRNQVCPLEPSICSRLGVTGPIQPGDTILIRSSAEVGLWGERVPPVDPVTHRATRMPPTASSVSRLERLTERCDDPVARVLEREVHSAGTLLSTAAILKARDEGRGQIDLATTTDTYHRDFARAIHPALQVFGADVAAGGAPRVVIAFALSADELMPVKSESSPASGSYPVQMQVMAANLSNGRRIDIDTVRRLSAQGTSGRGRTVTGLVEVPLPAGAYSVGVVLSQADGRGALAAARGVTLPRATAQLTVSDMVLGRENSGVQWNSGATNVALNPLGTYPKGGSAEVYFQLSGMTAGHTYQSKFEFFRADDAPDHGARLVISFAQPASQDRIEVSRTLGLKNLDAGRYRVKLTVSGDSLQTTATGWLTIEK